MKKIILSLLVISLLVMAACGETEPPVEEPEDIPDEEIVDDEDEEVIDDEDEEVIDDEDEEVIDDEDEEVIDDEETIEDDHIIGDLETEFAEGLFVYKLTVNKPTPCHEVIVEQILEEDNVLELYVDVVDTGEICPQVIETIVVEGEIEVEEEPEDVIVSLI